MTDRTTKDYATAKLVTVLRQPALPMERVDLILQILLENRGEVVGEGSVPRTLLQALRGVSVDARTRIHDALRFLSEYCKAEHWQIGNRVMVTRRRRLSVRSEDGTSIGQSHARLADYARIESTLMYS